VELGLVANPHSRGHKLVSPREKSGSGWTHKYHHERLKTPADPCPRLMDVHRNVRGNTPNPPVKHHGLVVDQLYPRRDRPRACWWEQSSDSFHYVYQAGCRATRTLSGQNSGLGVNTHGQGSSARAAAPPSAKRRAQSIVVAGPHSSPAGSTRRSAVDPNAILFHALPSKGRGSGRSQVVAYHYRGWVDGTPTLQTRACQLRSLRPATWRFVSYDEHQVLNRPSSFLLHRKRLRRRELGDAPAWCPVGQWRTVWATTKRSKFLAERRRLPLPRAGSSHHSQPHHAHWAPTTPSPRPRGVSLWTFSNRKFPAYMDTGLNLVDVAEVAARATWLRLRWASLGTVTFWVGKT